MNSEAATNVTETDREELRLLYTVSVGDIAFFKQQQWSVTNHGLALHVALVVIAFQLLSRPLATGYVWLLVVLAWAVFVAAAAMVERLQTSIAGRRTRLDRVRAHFGKPFRDAWELAKPKDDVHVLLLVVLFVSTAVVTWLFILRGLNVA